jgi:hypothetical protein
MRRWLGPADAVLQQAAWWWAVLLAARGAHGLAAAGALVAVGAHLLARPGERARVARAAAAAAIYGFATDSLLQASGLVHLAGVGAASPAWMVGLWAAFGAALTASLERALGWRALALAAAAALAGPLAYRGGAALDAIDLPGGAAALGAIAVQWALGAPLLARLARPSPRSRPGAAPTDSGLPAPAGRPRWAR